MTHRAEIIMQAVTAKISGLATTGENVFRGRAGPDDLQAGELPALLVWQGEDDIVSDLMHGEVVSRLTVTIEAQARAAATQIDTVLNAIREEVTVALAADVSIGLGFVHDLAEDGADAPEIDAGNAVAGRLAMNWVVTYQRNRANPAN